jgi:hypothetical protein
MRGRSFELPVDAGDPALEVLREKIEIGFHVGGHFAGGRAAVLEALLYAGETLAEAFDTLAMMRVDAPAVDEAVERLFDRGFESFEHDIGRIGVLRLVGVHGRPLVWLMLSEKRGARGDGSEAAAARR